jgi:flagellar hook-basal body complex protein FliE
MTMESTAAAAAYGQVARLDSAIGLPPRESGREQDFAAVLRGVAEGAVDSLRKAEEVSLQAAAGKADLNDLVTAMSKAEITLQTMVTMRDRVVQAYQEILRMPI